MRRLAFAFLGIFVLSTASITISTQSASAGNKSKRTVAQHTSSDLVNEANRWIGTNPTGWNRVWCARFMNFVLKRAGYPETGSDAASSFASYGRRVWGPQVGSIAVMTRGKNGGHVGVVTGVADDGRIIVVSGNHNFSGRGRVVGIGHYSPSRIYAYRMPAGSSSYQSRQTSQTTQQSAHAVY